MKNRIRLIRQNAGLTQQEFAKRIGVSRNTIATYETSGRNPIDAIVRAMCLEFNVNEEWLRTGIGDVYRNSNPDVELSKWFGQLIREDSDSFKKQLILKLSKMTDEEWKLLQKIVKSPCD